MKDSTRKLARAAISAAVSIVILLLASVLPTGKLALTCLASLSVIFIVMTASWQWALGTYAAASLLALLLLPQKAPALLFAAFLGYYPVVKLAAEKLPKKAVRWAIKLAVFNAAFLLFWFAIRPLVGMENWFRGSFIVSLLGGNAAFLLYDYALKELILLYIRKIARRIK